MLRVGAGDGTASGALADTSLPFVCCLQVLEHACCALLISAHTTLSSLRLVTLRTGRAVVIEASSRHVGRRPVRLMPITPPAASFAPTRTTPLWRRWLS